MTQWAKKRFCCDRVLWMKKAFSSGPWSNGCTLTGSVSAAHWLAEPNPSRITWTNQCLWSLGASREPEIEAYCSPLLHFPVSLSASLLGLRTAYPDAVLPRDVWGHSIHLGRSQKAGLICAERLGNSAAECSNLGIIGGRMETNATVCPLCH